MFDFIPFDMQSEIMKRLPVKSLIQFRSVSKKWKSLIGSPKFIKSYHINHTNPLHHLLLRYKLDKVRTYTSIIDNNTFPGQKFPLTAPDSLSLLTNTSVLGSVNGLLCFRGFYKDIGSRTEMVVIWNPTVRKSVGIVLPLGKARDVVGFGVCQDTSDPKLVKISVATMPTPIWEVEVFTLSTRVWKSVYKGVPFKLCEILAWNHVFVNGVIYFHAYDDINLDDGVRSNCVISFDFKSEKFGEVCLPERLAPTLLYVVKVKESLGLLEYYEEDMTVCGVWTRKDGANEAFTKIYNVKVKGELVLNRVLEFRNNGEVVIQVYDDEYEEFKIEVYEPLSGHITSVGINGDEGTFSTRSYMETLLLLDQSNSIIH